MKLQDLSERIEFLFRMFYAGNLLFVFQYLLKWKEYRVASSGMDAIYILYAITALICAATLKFRSARALQFLAFLGILYFSRNVGNYGHSDYVLVLTLFLLIFLPSGSAIAEKKLRRSWQNLIVLRSVQAQLLLTYSLSGFWKLFYGLLALFSGQMGDLSPSAMAYHAALKSMRVLDAGVLTNHLIQHPLLYYPGYLLTIFVQLFSLAILFRPQWHRAWGIYLIGFHFFSYMTLVVPFSTNILLIALFLIHSPQVSAFRNKKPCWKLLPAGFLKI